MLARVLAVVVCLSVCVSVTRRYCIETAVRIELIYFFAHSYFPSPCTTLCFTKIKLFKNNGTSSLELCPKLWT